MNGTELTWCRCLTGASATVSVAAPARRRQPTLRDPIRRKTDVTEPAVAALRDVAEAGSPGAQTVTQGLRPPT